MTVFATSTRWAVSRARRARGFTLLEMLVTLVIVALVATILAQALGQVARIERLLDGGPLRSASASLRAEWVRLALESLQPGTQDSERVRGSARELQGLSSAVPMWPGVGTAQMQLRLVASDDRRTTRLELRLNGSDDAPVVLHSWPGADGGFRYLDRQGAWLDHWPPETTDGVATSPLKATNPSLPRAVMLQTGAQPWGVLVAAPRVCGVPQSSRRQLEAL
jgi:prepilin-type N-terminal cleavage/methylation domain-containing protein